jgi:4-carboxymuconolactone decarboxylase
MYEELFEKGRSVMRKLGIPDMDLSDPQAQRTVGVLFGDLWADESQLSLQERELITLACLISLGGVEDPPLTSHMRGARRLGISREKIDAMINHLIFYAGDPKAACARRVLNAVFAEPAPDASARK